MKPTIRLNREDFKLSRMTPKVNIEKLKAGDEDMKLLRQPIVRMNRVAKNPFYAKINSVDKKDDKLHMKLIVRMNRLAKNPFYAKIKSKSLYKKFPTLKRIV